MNNKVLRRHPNGDFSYMFDNPSAFKETTAVQIFVLSAGAKEVLLQKRGPYKRLFPHKRTVSANAKIKKSEAENPQQIKMASQAAILKETGLEMRSDQIHIIGEMNGYTSQLIAFDFHAFTPQEDDRLLETYQSLKKTYHSTDGLLMDYSREKRALSVLSVSEKTTRDDVRRFSDEIEIQTGIPAIYPVLDRSQNTLAVGLLDEVQRNRALEVIADQTKAKEEARAALKNQQFSPAAMALIDSDEMEFVEWFPLRNDFQNHPKNYALDLTAPYLGNDAVWESILRALVPNPQKVTEMVYERSLHHRKGNPNDCRGEFRHRY